MGWDRSRLAKVAFQGIGGVLLVIASVCAAVGLAGQGVPAAVRFGAGIAGALLYAVGVWLFRTGRQLTAESVWEGIADDPRRPVLYLRAFKDDPIADQVPLTPHSALFALTASEEEQLAAVFSQIGPFVAIGRPGEALTQLGAARLYVSDDEWQDVVAKLMHVASLVLFRATDTDGFWWEIERSSGLLPPEQRLFLIPKGIDYNGFRHRATRLLGVEFPEIHSSRRSCGSLQGLVAFRRDGSSTFIPPAITTPLRNQIRQPLVAPLQLMARPVFEELGIAWRPPPINWLLITPYVVLFGVLPLVGVAALLLKGEFAVALAMTLMVLGFQGFMLGIMKLGQWLSR